MSKKASKFGAAAGRLKALAVSAPAGTIGGDAALAAPALKAVPASDAGDQAQTAALNASVAPAQTPTGRAPSRVGKKVISGHFPPQVSAQLGMLAAREGRSREDMLGEALNDLFQKYGLTRVA